MSEIRDRRGRFSKMPDHESNTERPPADSIENRIEQARADRAVGQLNDEGIPAVSGAREAVDVLGFDRVAAHNDGQADLDELLASQSAQRQAFEGWITGEALPSETYAGTWAVVDGHRIRVPLDDAGREQAIADFRAALEEQAQHIQTIDAANEGKFRCPI